MKKITAGIFMLFSALTWAQDGAVDSSFGTNGYVLVNRDDGASISEFIQPDGKIIYTQGKKIKRLNANGMPDTTFGVNGAVNIAQTYEYIENYLVANNQIIVLTKDLYDIYKIGRYNFDGTVEAGLGNGLGYATLNLGSDIKGHVRMKISKDGKLLIGGNSDTAYGSYNNYYVRKHNLDGTQDSSFNYHASSGINVAYTSIGYATDESFGDIDVTSTGEVIVSGLSSYHASTPTNTSYRRATFAIIPATNNQPAVKEHGYTAYTSGKSDLTLDQNDNIFVLSGQTGVHVIGKWTAAGNQSNSFGSSGLLTLPALSFGTDKKADFNQILIQPDGKILLGGTVVTTTSGSFGNPNLVMARYDQNGVLDTTFGTGGYVLFDIPHPNTPANYNYFTHFFTSADYGSIYMCGYNQQNVAVIKYNNNGMLAVSEVAKSSPEINVYPNPVSDWLNIKHTGLADSVSVYNMAGQEVMSESLKSNQTAINMSALPPATYLVKVVAENKVKTLKVVKK